MVRVAALVAFLATRPVVEVRDLVFLPPDVAYRHDERTDRFHEAQPVELRTKRNDPR